MPTDKEVGIRRIPAYTLHYTTDMFRRKCASLCSYYSYYYSTFPNACPRGKCGWMYYLSFLFHGLRILCPLHSVRTLICPGGAKTLAVGFRLFSTNTAAPYFFLKISIFKTFESIQIVRTLNRDSYMNRFFSPTPSILLCIQHISLKISALLKEK